MTLATIQRMRHDRDGVACFPFVEHRSRDKCVLLPDVEWGWSENPRDAYVFPLKDRPAVRGHDDYERSAQCHFEALVAEGETNRLIICSYGEANAQARALKQMSKLAQMEESVRKIDPAAVYEETQRRLGERD